MTKTTATPESGGDRKEIGHKRTFVENDKFKITERMVLGKLHVSFSIDNQTFLLANHGVSSEHNKFIAHMLEIALEKLVENTIGI